MAFDISYYPSIRIDAGTMLKNIQPDTELYVGQILKSVVIKSSNGNEVLLTINGHNINAKTAHPLEAGQTLKLKVVETAGEIQLEIVDAPNSRSVIESALAQTLPKQLSATHLFATLTALQHNEMLPQALKLQINQLVGSIINVNQLPQFLAQALAQSGSFLEYHILANKQHAKRFDIKKDFKSQCLSLLAILIDEEAPVIPPIQPDDSHDNLLLHTIPQPQPQLPPQSFEKATLNQILGLLQQEVLQVLARIKTNQLTHLLQSPDMPFCMMLDLPIRSAHGLDIVPIVIKQHASRKPNTAPSWSISFAVNLSELGGIQGHVKLEDSGLDILIHTEKEETLERLTNFQEGIDELFSNIGLTLHSWSLQLGLEMEESHPHSTNLRLLDVRI